MSRNGEGSTLGGRDVSQPEPAQTNNRQGFPTGTAIPPWWDCRKSLSLSDLAVGYFPGPPPRPPRVLARLHAETARRQALRLAPRHDHLTPFTVNQGLKVRVGAAPLAPPAGHPSHVFPGNRHHFHPQPHCTAVSNHLKIYAVYGKSVGTSPRDYGGQGQVRGPAKRTTALATLDSEKRGARWPSYGKPSGSKPNSSRRC